MDVEFDDVAAATASALDDVDLEERIIAASRGSGNPASLAWLAEGCGLGPGHTVVDLGSGLGGPAAWLARRYRCRVVAVEPASGAAEGADSLFDAPVVRGEAGQAPLRDAAVSAALVLGVLSVVDDPRAVLVEAGRVAEHVAVLEYVSTGPQGLAIGGSWFPTATELRHWCAEVGLTVVDAHDQLLPAPPRWREVADRLTPSPEPGPDGEPLDGSELDEAARSEADVVGAIADRRLVAHVLIARRTT